LGQHLAGEFDDRGLGRDVAADADIPLRLVAFASTGPDLRETEPYAGRSRPEGEELSYPPMVAAVGSNCSRARRRSIFPAISYALRAVDFLHKFQPVK
jgi:hypothetical protein